MDTTGRAEPLLRARGLRKEYGKGDGLVYAVAGVDLDVARGQTLAVMGPSGCGKSTLLHLLGGLDRPSGGELWLNGRRTDRLGERALAEPTGNLDSAAALDVLRLFGTLRSSGMTLVIVTHDSRVAATAGRVISMRDGAFASETRPTGGATAHPPDFAEIGG
jgi:ABC-type lipoprotein export system ATPase subunit